MKFALVQNNKVEATKGAKGVCPVCGFEVIAKCGEKNRHHWAHKIKCTDLWRENETDWHRNWKNQFPEEWQEVVHFDDSGEKHIADVKTPENWVVEVQHSFIDPKERRSRNKFYNTKSNLIWIVDGTRRPTDLKQFKDELGLGVSRYKKPFFIEPWGHSRLLKEWKNTDVFVFLDFGANVDFGKNDIDKEYLWCICPQIYNGKAFLTKITKSGLIKSLQNMEFGETLQNRIIEPLIKLESLERENDIEQQRIKAELKKRYGNRPIPKIYR